MGDMTRTNFLKQRLMVKMKFSLRLNILTTNSCLQSEKKLWRATVMMLLTWTVAWTPYALMFLASISGHRDLITHHGNMWAGNVQTREAIFTKILLSQQFSCSPDYIMMGCIKENVD